MGLREDKKRVTRKTISDMATRLFAERGYDAVTTAEIAERAGVSVPTLFNYFPTKEALVFDDDGDTEAKMVQVVRDRKPGQSTLDALRASAVAELASVRRGQAAPFMKLIDETPALSRYARQMWLRHEQSLGAAIRKGSKLSKLEAEAIARYVLDACYRAMSAPRPRVAVEVLFKLLETGWRG